MQPIQTIAEATERQARTRPPVRPSLSAHYKPVGIQAVTAATVCKAPKPQPKRPAVLPEDS